MWNGHNEYNRTRFEFVNYHKNALCYNVFNIGRYSTIVEYPTKNTIQKFAWQSTAKNIFPDDM